MSGHMNVLGYFVHAGFVVKGVMLLLGIASIASWTFIFERYYFFKNKKQETLQFLHRFWNSKDISQLYQSLESDGSEKSGILLIFCEGFRAYWARQGRQIKIEVIQRVMQIEQAKESITLQEHLPFFASVGSIAPFIGLFGTVWGIMTSFQALGQAQQATIAMVAPGISEALVATALGLFTAIPAVIAYNRFAQSANGIEEQLTLFQEELIALMELQSDEQGAHAGKSSGHRHQKAPILER